MKKKLIALVMVLALVVGGAIGGTIAWLTTTSSTITNTFTIGDINITLTETGTSGTTQDFPFVPGATLAKEPKVTVAQGSENAYVFVKVDVVNNKVNGKHVVEWAIAGDWKYINNGVEETIAPEALFENGTYYFYREYAKNTTAPVDYQVLAGGTYGQVTINELIDKTDADSTLDAAKPAITFTAAAVQKDNIGGLAAAWGALPTTFKP